MNPDLHMSDELKNTGARQPVRRVRRAGRGNPRRRRPEIRVKVQSASTCSTPTPATSARRHGRHRRLVHRHRLQRGELLRPPRLFPRRQRSLQEPEDRASGRDRRGSLGDALFATSPARSARPESGPHRREGHQPLRRRGDEGVQGLADRCGGTSFNGYNWRQRSKIIAAFQCATGLREPFEGAPCAMCGDPDRASGEWHSEDYSEPFSFQPPESYPVCKACHGRIHKRFDAEPGEWELFCLHLDAGGYGSEFVKRLTINQRREYSRALASGSSVTLAEIRPRMPGARWWRSLTLDPKFA